MHESPDIEKLHEDLLRILETDDDGQLHEHLQEVRAPDVAELMELLEDLQRSRVLFALDSRAAAEVIALLDEHVRDEVVDDIPGEHLARMVDELPADDAADLVGELSDEESDELMGRLSRAQSEQVGKLLEYDAETAGGLMDPAVLRVLHSESVSEAIERVRSADLTPNDVLIIFATDRQGHLRGALTPQRLLVAAPGRQVIEIMDPDPIRVTVEEDQEDVVHLFMKYDLTALPVTDERGVLLGQITVDDVMDVAAEEADEDIYHMGGTDPAEMETSSILRASRIRLAWLLPSFLLMSCTALVILFGERYFAVDQYGALIAFVPMIGALAGCCSVQTSTVITRGLATGDLAATKLKLVATREGPIALVMAPACAVVAWLVVRFLTPVLQALGEVHSGVSHSVVANAVGLGMLVAIVLASALGILMPFVFRRMGIDPAIAAGPLVTAANDVLSVSVYLLLAHSVLLSTQ